MKTLFYAIILSFVYLSSIMAGTIDPNVPDYKYIEYGKDFHYIGKICGSYNDKSLFCASAVVIKKNYILTAAHVVKNANTCVLKIKDKEFIVDKFIIPEDYDSDKYGTNDIAIGYINENIQLDFYPELYDKSDELGKLCSISGYGITGDFNTGADKSDNIRRAGSNVVEEIDRQLLICRPSKPSDNRRTSLEFLISSGDSGGGLFIGNRLAGINSCVSGIGKKSLNSTYSTESGHTRISVHREWILNHIQKNKP